MDNQINKEAVDEKGVSDNHVPFNRSLLRRKREWVGENSEDAKSTSEAAFHSVAHVVS